MRVFAPAKLYTPSNAAVKKKSERLRTLCCRERRNIMATKYGTRRPTFSYSARANQYAECAIISYARFEAGTHTHVSFPVFVAARIREVGGAGD